MDNAKLAAELTRDEGERLRMYTDTVGKETIGVGRNLTDKGIRKDESALMLSNDIAETCASLNQRLPWWNTLTDARQRVLANMAFNMGMGGLLGFKNTLELVRTGKYSAAADAMLQSKWATQVGQRAVRLSDMMRAG